MSQLALVRPLLQIKRKEKKRKTIFKTKRKRKRKEILNNDLAILPSHDTTPLLSFLVPRNFLTIRNMGQPCCPSRHCLLLSIL